MAASSRSAPVPVSPAHLFVVFVDGAIEAVAGRRIDCGGACSAKRGEIAHQLQIALVTYCAHRSRRLPFAEALRRHKRRSCLGHMLGPLAAEAASPWPD